jgi:Domain of unknown function (DUF5666)
MKKLLLLSCFLFSWVFAEDELKVYGIITYLAQDNSSLRVGDMTVILSESDIEGVLTVGSLVKVEGSWQGQTFYAEEVKVEHPQVEVVVYRGLVQAGKLLGIDLPGLTDGEWLEVIAERQGEGLNILLIKPLTQQQSSLQATVESLTQDGFSAGGVNVVSSQTVSIGQQVTVQGNWNGSALIEASFIDEE